MFQIDYSHISQGPVGKLIEADWRKYASPTYAIIGSDNGLSPGRRQPIIWTNAGILLIEPLGRNFSEILIEIYTFSFKKIHLKMLSGKCRFFCLGLNVLKVKYPEMIGSMLMEQGAYTIVGLPLLSHPDRVTLVASVGVIVLRPGHNAS